MIHTSITGGEASRFIYLVGWGNVAQSKAARNRSMQKMRKTNYFNIVVVVCKTRSPSSCRLVFEYLETKWLECTKKERLWKTENPHVYACQVPSSCSFLVCFPIRRQHYRWRPIAVRCWGHKGSICFCIQMHLNPVCFHPSLLLGQWWQYTCNGWFQRNVLGMKLLTNLLNGKKNIFPCTYIQTHFWTRFPTKWLHPKWYIYHMTMLWGMYCCCFCWWWWWWSWCL